MGRALRRIAEAAREAGTDLTLCGEMASRPLTAMALIGLGYRSLSMSPAAIGPVKAAAIALDAAALTAEMDAILAPPIEPGDVPPSLRDVLRAHAERAGIAL